MILQSTPFDVMRDTVALIGTISMPFVLVLAARWQNKVNAKVAERVAATAAESAERVASTVVAVAAKADEKVEAIVGLSEKTHKLVNSQHTELMDANKAQGKEIKRLERLLLKATPSRRRPPARRRKRP